MGGDSTVTAAATVASPAVPNNLINIVAGGSAGLTATLITYPLDLIKTRFQVSDGHRAWSFGQYRSTTHALSSIWRANGISGLYSGLGASLIGAGAAWASFFFLYGATKTKLLNWRGGSEPLSPAHNLLAAANAGALTSVITNPIWVIKTRMQTQAATAPAPAVPASASASAYYRSSAHAFRDILRSEGWSGLYRGLIPSLWNVSHGSIQFMSYEELRRRAVQHLADNSPPNSPHSPQPQLSNLHFLALGAASKIIASTVTYPTQLARARLQMANANATTLPNANSNISAAAAAPTPPSRVVAYTGFIQTLSTTYRYEGIRGLYKGWIPTIARVTPASCINFLVYERMSAFLRAQYEPKR